MNYFIRRATDTDLETLVTFTLAESREAEGIELEPSIVREVWRKVY
ncbi:MAG: hypothetical protein GTO18_18935 [Anaerolineales bacterium]|nr:hypothetical protein [Anaerolineales bacterium]